MTAQVEPSDITPRCEKILQGVCQINNNPARQDVVELLALFAHAKRKRECAIVGDEEPAPKRARPGDKIKPTKLFSGDISGYKRPDAISLPSEKITEETTTEKEKDRPKRKSISWAPDDQLRNVRTFRKAEGIAVSFFITTSSLLGKESRFCQRPPRKQA